MKKPRNPFSEEPEEDFQGPHFALIVAVICFFFMIMLRLWYLQIIRGQEFRIMSDSNRIRVQDILPTRGLITDRNGTILVDNSPSYDLAIIRKDVANTTTLLSRLSFHLGRSYEDIQELFEKVKVKSPFKPATLISGLSREELVAVETNRFKLPGVAIEVKPRRRYHYPYLASHVIGYMGEITQDQLKDPTYINHRLGDWTGQYGIEKEFEPYLHGRRGQQVVEVNASGRVLKVIDYTPPDPGNNLHLTIDLGLQEAAQEALGDQVGAVVAVDPNTGEILAMASTPTYNQSNFVMGISRENWKELLDNPLHPLENRAVSGQYPPGSTFKIISAAAALEEGVVTPETRIMCPGSFTLGNQVYNCWKRSGHGKVNLHRALKESCDVYFYEVSLKLGVDKLAEYARAFGLGRPTGVGLANEKSGLVPTKAWKKRRYNVPWRMGETVSIAIGQGYNLTTPIQMAQVMAATANGGTLYQFHMVKEITSADGKTKKSFPPQVVGLLRFKPETLEQIRAGLTAVVEEQGGTGSHARVKGVNVAGKTGTSQVVSLKKYRNVPDKDIPYKYRDHAWFVAFAPVENPKIALAVLVEHAGHGGSEAGPVAQKVLQAFFYPETPLTPGLSISEEPL